MKMILQTRLGAFWFLEAAVLWGRLWECLPQNASQKEISIPFIRKVLECGGTEDR